MKRKNGLLLTIVAAGLAYAGSASALLVDQNVTPDVIFGSGNANGSWTVDQNLGVELGLRGKVRFDLATGSPENTFNSNGDGTYSFPAGVPSGQTFPTAVWSVEWAINTNFDNSSGSVLDDLVYAFGVDTDPTLGTNFEQVDIINVLFADHALGDNATGNGGGFTAGGFAEYATLISTENVAQNSWQATTLLGPGFDPTVNGTYDFYLAAFDGNGAQVARTDIQIIVGQGGSVPVPGTVALLALGLFGLRLVRKQSSTRS